MWASEARMLMETHLAEFFEVSPDDIPSDLVEDMSPLFAMGWTHGLSIASARRYVDWLQQTNRIDEQQAHGLHDWIALTEQTVTDIRQRSTRSIHGREA